MVISTSAENRHPLGASGISWLLQNAPLGCLFAAEGGFCHFSRGVFFVDCCREMVVIPASTSK